MSKPIALDTAYLTPSYWWRWNAKLKRMENKIGLKRIEVEKISEPIHGFGYKVWYENPGIKKAREAKREIRSMWSTFENPLSRHFKQEVKMYVTYIHTLSPAQKRYGDPKIIIITEYDYEWFTYYGCKFDCVFLIPEIGGCYD